MKRIYTFGNGQAEGRADMKNLLGGKGANLAEMNLIGVPVPPGFTITTEVCTEYNTLGREAVVKILEEDVKKSVAHIEKLTGNTFGDAVNPLLVSVRSGARVSMPGMMDTVLNLGINDTVVEALSKKSGNPRFAWDSYRRFVQMYGDVVLGMKPKSKQDIDPFEEILDKVKEEKGVKNDTELTVDDLKGLVVKFKAAVKKSTGKDFPESAWEQLWGAIYAVFDSWMNERAILYRRMNQIPEEWGTAVNVQAMVYGNMGNTSATGVAFTRDAATGEDIFNGEYLINAQGEDVVAGVRTPQQITTEGSRRWAALQGISEEERASKYPSLEESMPECAKELIETQQKLEDYFKDMQDLEFTIQDNKLWLLQTRNGKRTGAAMVKIAMDLLRAGEIDEKTVLRRMEPQKLDELLHPVFDKDDLKRAQTVAKGLPASPGAATGQIVFFADDAEAWSEMKKKVIMVRIETSPEDLRGMSVAQGILTARGGMTSHAAVVARGMGKCCVSGAGEIKVDYKEKTVIMDGKTYKEGDWISLNGSTGDVYDGQVPTVDAELSGDFAAIMNLAEKYPDNKIIVIDSLCASMGEGLFVHKAVMMKEEGKSIDEIAAWLEENKLHVVHNFTVDDLFHLYRGGRVSKTAAVVGSMINLKPILHVDNEGHLIPLSKVRGRKKSLIALVDSMQKQIGAWRDKNDIVFISHGDSLEDAQFVAELIKKRLGIENFLINHIGPTIGAHSGPGTIALFYMGDYR